MEGGSINYNADSEIIERGETIVIFPNSVRNTQVVEDYMVVDSIRGVGVVKFVNNQFAIFMRTSADIATPAKYMTTRSFPGFTDYQFDHE
jgi:hypothetical protein